MANRVCAVFVGGHRAQERVGQDENFSSAGSLEACDPDFAAAAADVADAADGVAVVGEGSQADDSGNGGNGLSATLSELGQVNQHGAGNLRADADDSARLGIGYAARASGSGDSLSRVSATRSPLQL